MATEVDANTPAELPSELPPPKLRPGLIQTSGDFEPLTIFRVPEGWNGNQDSDGFAIGEGVDVAAQEFDRASIYVRRIGTGDVPIETAMNRFGKLSGLTILSEDSTTVGGFEGRTYEISVFGEHVLLDALDERLAGGDIPQGKHQVTLVDVRGQSLMITLAGDTEADRSEAQEVLASFTFPR